MKIGKFARRAGTAICISGITVGALMSATPASSAEEHASKHPISTATLQDQYQYNRGYRIGYQDGYRQGYRDGKNCYVTQREHPMHTDDFVSDYSRGYADGFSTAYDAAFKRSHWWSCPLGNRHTPPRL